MGKEQASKYRSFKEEFPFGQTAQDRVRDMLSLHGAFCNKVEDKGRYDFECVFNNHSYRVEVKNEDRKKNTGNLCIETRQSWNLKPSGLSITEAVICIHTLGENCALYRVREMKAYLRQEQQAGRQHEIAFGDNNNRGYLVAIKMLQNFWWFDFRPFSTLPDSKLWTL